MGRITKRKIEVAKKVEKRSRTVKKLLATKRNAITVNNSRKRLIVVVAKVETERENHLRVRRKTPKAENAAEAVKAAKAKAKAKRPASTKRKVVKPTKSVARIASVATG